MPRALADVREAQPAQQLANRPFMIVDAEAAPDQRLQIDAAPAHDAVRLKVRSRVNEARKLGLLLPGQPRRGPRCLAVDQSQRPRGTLNRCTQSRSVCRSIAPSRAATSRLIPS